MTSLYPGDGLSFFFPLWPRERSTLIILFRNYLRGAEGPQFTKWHNLDCNLADQLCSQMAKKTWPSPFLLMLPGLCPEPLLALHLASPWIVLLELAWFLPLSMVCPAHLCTSPSLNGNLSIVCISSLLAPDHMSLTLADSSSCFFLPPGTTLLTIPHTWVTSTASSPDPFFHGSACTWPFCSCQLYSRL